MIELNRLTPQAKVAFATAVESIVRPASTDKGVPQWIGVTRPVPESVSCIASGCYGLAMTTERRGIHFDPFAVVDYYGTDDVALLETYVGESVYPLAVLSCAYAFLTGTGRVVVLDSDWLFFHAFRDVHALLNWLFAEDVSYVDERRELLPSERP